MSVEAMTWAFNVPLPPCPKSVLVALANRADEDGYCWPGIEDLERRTGWKRRAIQLAIRQLVADQLVTVSPRYLPSMQQNSNLYRLEIGRMPTPISCGEGASHAPRGVHQVHGEGASHAPLGVHHMHGEGAPHAPKSSSESSSEQSVEQSSLPGASAPVVVPEGASAPVWEAYAKAYRERYGVDPVRNGQTNALLVRLVKKLGQAEAPKVAAFYLTSTKAVYVSNKHPCTLLVRDAEGLRTEWAMGASPLAPPQQAKCAWVNGGDCQDYAKSQSKYCGPHGVLVKQAQDRLKNGGAEIRGPNRPVVSGVSVEALMAGIGKAL